MPSGYNIVGVYDETGQLFATTDCVQTLVANEQKVVAFEVVEVNSPEPWLKATLKVKNPKGKKSKHQITASDLRKNTFKDKLKKVKKTK